MEKIQELTEKIYREGVEKGQQEAERIIAEARQEAEKIVAEAKEQAQAIEQVAKKKAAENSARAAAAIAEGGAQETQHFRISVPGGNTSVSFIFLPGSQFNFSGFRFEKQNI